MTNTWAARLGFERVGASCCRGALRVRPAGYPQQLGRLDLQHSRELGDDLQSRIAQTIIGAAWKLNRPRLSLALRLLDGSNEGPAEMVIIGGYR